MGQILILLAQKAIQSSPALQSTRLQIEENVGEAIHIHYRDLRFELTRAEFIAFASAIDEAHKRMIGELKD